MLKAKNINNWIFVTGVPRSGTTFVGKVLSLPREVDYIHEPFNPQCGVPGVDMWYRYMRATVDTDKMKEIDAIARSIFSYNFRLRTFIPEFDTWNKKLVKQVVGSRGPFNLFLAKLNIFHKAAIIKDPIGNLMTEYLYLTFGVKPVIIIKHPTSFVASLKRVNWWPTLSKLNDQTSLLEDYFPDEVDFFYKKWSEPYLEAAAFWRVIYKVLLSQGKKYSSWQIITHESLSTQPIVSFKRLYSDLDLRWSPQVEKKILSWTQDGSKADVKQGVVQDFKRNSSDIFEMRRDSLTLEERKHIFEIVEDVALQIYSKESFSI